MICQDLGDWKKGFDGKTHTSKEIDVGFRAGDEWEEDMDDEERDGKVTHEGPVSV